MSHTWTTSIRDHRQEPRGFYVVRDGITSPVPLTYTAATANAEFWRSRGHEVKVIDRAGRIVEAIQGAA